MIVKYNRPQGKIKYVITTDSSAYFTVSDKMRVKLPNYMQEKVSVDQELNESSSDI